MPTENPSRTARKIALNIVTLGAKAGMDKVLPPGIVDATADLLVASGAVGATTVRWSRSRVMVAVYEAFDWLLPGQFEAFGHRKAFFERLVRKAIGADATQVLVLGAGLDTMGWRLAPEFSAVNFFEIDHPATARLKARGIEQMGQRSNLHLLGEDLRKHRLADVLRAYNAWNQTAQTVIVAEGLLMYLPPEAVRDVLRQCAAVSGDGSTLAFSYIPTGANELPYAGRWTGLMLWILKLAGEPWLWSIRPEELPTFLEANGWTSATAPSGSPARIGVELLAVALR